MQNENPVVFYSRKLNSTNENYTTMENELLSTVETTVCYRNILFGFKIHSHSDHKSLSFENFKSEHVHRLWIILEEYDYTPLPILLGKIILYQAW